MHHALYAISGYKYTTILQFSDHSSRKEEGYAALTPLEAWLGFAGTEPF